MTPNQLGFLSSFDNIFPVLILFVLIYLIFNKRSQSGKKSSKRLPRKNGKVIDLTEFRERRESQKKATAWEPERENNWINLYTASSPSELELVHSLLTSYDIECNISHRHSASLYPSVEGLNMILQVRFDDQQRCLEILREHDLSLNEF